MNKRLQQRLSTEIAESVGGRLCLQVRKGDKAEALAYIKEFNLEAQSVLAGLPLSRPMHLEAPSNGQIEVVEGPLIDLGRFTGAWLEVGFHPYEFIPHWHIPQKDLEGLIRRMVKSKSAYFSVRSEDTALKVPSGINLIIREVTHRNAANISSRELSASHQRDSSKSLELRLNEEMYVWEFMREVKFHLLDADPILKN